MNIKIISFTNNTKFQTEINIKILKLNYNIYSLIEIHINLN